MEQRQRVVVIGPGRMGLGTARSFALNRVSVAFVDVKEEIGTRV